MLRLSKNVRHEGKTTNYINYFLSSCYTFIYLSVFYLTIENYFYYVARRLAFTKCRLTQVAKLSSLSLWAIQLACHLAYASC